MEETGSSEMIRLLPLSQSTDHLHHPKKQQISSGQKLDENNQRPNNQNCILQNCELTSGPLPKPSHPEGKGLNSVVQVLEQSASTNKHSNAFINLGNLSLCRVPSLSVGRSQSQSVTLELLHSSSAPSPAETDNDVSKDSLSGGSEKTSNLPFPYIQNKNSIPNRTPPEPALTVSASIKEKQIKENNAW